jgi:hypothetical protein
MGVNHAIRAAMPPSTIVHTIIWPVTACLIIPYADCPRMRASLEPLADRHGIKRPRRKLTGITAGALPTAGDAHCRRPVEARAVGVERWAVHRLIAGAARPCGVSAGVPEAGLMPDEHLPGA